MTNTIPLKELSNNSLVQILTNGDYDGCERELDDPITLDEFKKDHLYLEDEKDENENEYLKEWELPDGGETKHLLTIIGGKLVRVVGE